MSGKKNSSTKKNTNTSVNSIKKKLFLEDKNFWILFLPIVCILIYANTLFNGFVLDDVAVITENKFVKQGFAGFGKILSTFYWQGYWDNYSGLYRPLSLILFATEWQLVGNNPFFFHLISVVLYALTSIVLFKFLLKILNQNVLFAALAGLIYVLNPMHTEVVANIKSTDEILCFLFFLLGANQFINYIETNKKKSWIGSAAFLFLALLSKEGALLFVPVLGLILFLFYKTPIKKIIVFLIPHLLICIIWYGIHWAVIKAGPSYQAYTWRDNSLFAVTDFVSQKATAIGILGRYIIKSIIPYQLSYDYSFPQISNTGFLSLFPLLGLVLSGTLIFVAIKKIKENPILSFSILFFLITISLTSNVFVKIGATAADRFLYVPSLGAAIILAYFITKIKVKKITNYFIIASPLLLFYSFKTISRNNVWKTNFDLYTTDVNTSPNSSRVNHNYATVLFQEGYLQENNPEKKIQLLNDIEQHYAKAIELDPKDPGPWSGLGITKYKQKDFKAAANALATSLKIFPEDYLQLSNLGDAYFMNKQYDSAIYCHKICIEKNVIYKETYNFLGNSYFQKQDYTAAINAFATGVKREPTYSELWLNYGNALAINKNYDEALISFKKAYELKNTDIQPLYFIALTFQNIGKLDSTQKYLNLYNSLKTAK